jgi:hypothetical protein
MARRPHGDGAQVEPPTDRTDVAMNLDGSRSNAGRHEWEFFVEMASSTDRFPVLYNLVMLAAREVGIRADQLPDFLDIEGLFDFDLLGQDELASSTFDTVVAVRAAKKRLANAGYTDDTAPSDTDR